MPQFIEEDAILLPDFLFYFDDLKSKSISPAASFDPTTATSSGGFQSSSSPSNNPNKRSIILDKSSVSNLEYGEQIALVKRLQIAGFSIFLCCSSEGRNVFCKVDDDLNNIKQLHSLANFAEVDYNDLAKSGVARDQALIMNHSDRGQMSAVKRAFSHTNYTGKISGNDWKCEMRVFTDDEIEEVAKRIIRIKEPYYIVGWKEQLAFYLNKATPDQQSNILRWCGDLESEMLLFLANPNLKKFSNGTPEDLQLSASLKKVEMTPRLRVAGMAKIFPDQEDEIIESYFTEAGEKLGRRSQYLAYDILFLIKKFPNQKEKLIKILKDSHERSEKLDNLDEITVRLQKSLIDIFEGRVDEVIETFPPNDADSIYISTVIMALLTEGVMSEKLLKRMGRLPNNIHFALESARGLEYEIIETLTNYSFKTAVDNDAKLSAISLMTGADLEKAEELMKNHKPNFSYEGDLQ